MLKKILIANRGEIAIRIMRSCREMGIDSVAVYSSADRDALHVQMAREAICIGGPKPADSYLNMQNILTAALHSGCDAIHPAYGFLSEQAEFAELTEAAGLVFIGPRPETIRQLGDKAEARKLMQAAGVPVVPGSSGTVETVAEAKSLASELEYPILIKAAAGGGGRGMRLVKRAEELAEAFREARKEAFSAFKSPNLYLEKFIPSAKHIEFQILADSEGRVVQLGERDCSLQRKRQKIIEEAPAPGLKDELRERMAEAAIRAAKSLNYLGAGTVEFILTEDGKFYFIEVNTRIQVEHPLTEMLTSIDLVKEQIRIAGGAGLSFKDDAVKVRGHAIECRINAECPREDFRPSAGRIKHFSLPGGFAVRVDSAIYPGCEISPYYDSLIAKLIVHAPSRSEAIRRMRRCLEELIIEGVDTNAALLYVLLFENSVIRGDFDTRYIERNIERLLEYSKLMEN